MPLKVSDGIGAYIDDFQKSDAPQFKGKSKKERRDMAIAAYLTAKRGGKAQDENVKSADRKPEIYTKPDGKKGIRMVATDREVVKTEAYTMGKPVEKKKPKPASDSRAAELLTKGYPYGSSSKKAKQNEDLKKLKPDSAMMSNVKSILRNPKAGGNTSWAAKQIAMTHGQKALKHPSVDRALKKHAETNEALDVGEKTYMRTDSKLKNLKVPVKRRSGKIIKPEFKLATPRKEALDSKDKPFVKDLVKKLRGGSKVHAKQADDLEKAMKTEAMNFAVSIEGLPTMFMSADSPGMLKQTLRKIVKQPSMIQSVKRVTDAKVKKTFRLKAQGRDEEMKEDTKLLNLVRTPGGKDHHNKMSKYHYDQEMYHGSIGRDEKAARAHRVAGDAHRAAASSAGYLNQHDRGTERDRDHKTQSVASKYSGEKKNAHKLSKIAVKNHHSHELDKLKPSGF